MYTFPECLSQSHWIIAYIQLLQILTISFKVATPIFSFDSIYIFQFFSACQQLGQSDNFCPT